MEQIGFIRVQDPAAYHSDLVQPERPLCDVDELFENLSRLNPARANCLVIFLVSGKNSLGYLEAVKSRIILWADPTDS